MDSILLPPLVFQKEKICSWFLSFGPKLFEVSWGVAGREELILALAIGLLVGICKHLGGQERAVQLAGEPWFLLHHCHVLRELNLCRFPDRARAPAGCGVR